MLEILLAIAIIALIGTVLIGGGAGLLASTSRWNVYYNYSYRNCMRR